MPQKSWACKIIANDNVIIGGLHHRTKFATTDVPRPSPQDLVLSFHTPVELNPYQQIAEIGYNALMEFP